MLALLLLTLSAAASGESDNLPCMFESRRQGFVQRQACAVRDGSRLRLQPFVLRHARFDRYGLTSFSCDGNWWYARRDGRTQRMDTMDNGADEFQAGLARAISGRKVGYVDRRLHFVIPARYDGAMPFAQGRADVCNGCVEMTEGEHSVLGGGSWGVGDRSGREVKALHPQTQTR